MLAHQAHTHWLALIIAQCVSQVNTPLLNQQACVWTVVSPSTLQLLEHPLVNFVRFALKLESTGLDAVVRLRVNAVCAPIVSNDPIHHMYLNLSMHCVIKAPTMLHRLIIAAVILCLLPKYDLVCAVAPGDGWFYSSDGGYENSCGISPCQTDCNIGYYRSGCSGNTNGSCVPCDNEKPPNSHYNTKGSLNSDCKWSCNVNFAKSLSGLECISSTLCSKNIPEFATYSNTNTPYCDHQCIAGYFNSQTSTNPESCSICPAGTYALQGATVCSACPAGTFSDLSGSPSAINCQACAAGTYSVTTGASLPSTCIKCQAGTYSNEVGAGIASACQPCPIGTFSASTGAVGVAVCAQCTAGKYANITGRTTCTDCDAGTYASISGATNCMACSLNTFASSTGMVLCKQCEICAATGFYKAGCGPISSGYCTQCTNPAVY